ncbi:tetratricopeptide repeat protein [Sphaerotilus sp.]|jgi:predicted O-linked N-acetylglucosamine transferase (SPINDLY family)|uniref:O-linked N-acetylglucosamine transferase, SPINDLY family protein n=1 Tax=Sphaerotilus sp. TaxID=2093942 RepID=UPI0025E31CE7|nr:tetratricopeptide repeat protein [Sphaerotilus sp.]
MTAATRSASRPASRPAARPVTRNHADLALARRLEQRGRELLRKGQVSAAQAQFARAVQADPAHQLCWLLLAQCDHRLGQAGPAAEHLGRAYRLNHGDAQVCQLLADCLLESHRHAEAIAALQQLDPEVERSGHWHLAKAKAHLALQDFEGTVRECSAALGKAGADVAMRQQALQGLGHGLMKCEGHVEAAWCYRMLLDANPLDFGAALSAAHASSWACDWDGLAGDFERLRHCIGQVESSGRAPVTGRSPFALITLTDDPGILQWAAMHTYREHCAGLSPVPHSRTWRVPRPNGKIRIGLLSSDFHVHATSILIAECLEGMDRDQFELYFYSGGKEDRSELRARVRRTATCWVETADLSTPQLVARIRDDEIGVLLDMKGYTLGARMDVLVHRPAPLQVSWLGYPGTTGADCLDYVVGDAVLTPLEAQPSYTECIAQMPHCYQPNDSTRTRPPVATRQQCGLPEDAFVFAGFNMPYKIVPEVFEAWCCILRETPGAVLWLLVEQEPTRLRLQASARRHGVDPQRLVFAPFLVPELHRARLPLADLCLDTFPCGGHTTASDALWAGVPVLALLGESFASRVAGSLLHALGVPELACRDIESYMRSATTLARDPAAFRALKAKIEQGRLHSALFDGRRFAADFGRLLLRMVQRQDAGLPPAPLAAETAETDAADAVI